MPVMNIPGAGPWFAARYEFRLLFEAAERYTDDPAETYSLKQAVALDGLHFELAEARQRRGLARALDLAATDLQRDLDGRSGLDQRDLEFRRSLDDLRAVLAQLTGQ